MQCLIFGDKMLFLFLKEFYIGTRKIEGRFINAASLVGKEARGSDSCLLYLVNVHLRDFGRHSRLPVTLLPTPCLAQ